MNPRHPSDPRFDPGIRDRPERIRADASRRSHPVVGFRNDRTALPCWRLPVVLAIAIAMNLNTAAAGAESRDPLAVDVHQHTTLEADPVLSLREVVARTVREEAGSLVVSARREEAAELKRNASRVLSGAPVVSASHVSDGLLTGEGYQQWDVGLELPLWWPGQRRGRRDGAQAASDVARQSARVHAWEVAGWVRASVAALALAEVRLELAESEWRAEQVLVGQLERAVALDEHPRSDLLLAQSASMARQLRFLEVLEEFRDAEGAYFLLTGLSRWPANWGELHEGMDSFESHPLLLLARETTARARGELERLVGDRWGHPVLELGTQHERDRSGTGFNDRFVAGLRIPIGRRKDSQATIARARRELAEALRDQRRLERALRGRLKNAEHSLAIADERVSAAAGQAEMAAEYLRLSERGFALGEIDLGTLLRARSRSIAARQAHREALVLRQAAAGEMNQALGVVP